MTSSYQQANLKRQKVRDTRVVEPADCFQGIDKIDYNNMATPTDTLTYKYYNHSERINGRSMEDWLKLSISYTAFRQNGSEIYGKSRRNWDDGTNSLDNFKRQLKLFFEFCQKLGIKYWTAFDSDLVPYCENLDDWKTLVDEMVEFVQECNQRYHMKLLWIAPNLHSHFRYASGAATNPETNIFITATTQVKKILETAQKLSAENVLFWPIREGYFNQYKLDINREIELLAKFYKMTAEYKERVSFRGSLLILPGYNDLNNTDNLIRYMGDALSSLCFLKHYNLERYFKLIVVPGHEMYTTLTYNCLGGIQIKRDSFENDSRNLSEMMKCIIDQGCPIPAGLNIHIRARRDGLELRDYMYTLVRGIDNIARAFRTAASLISDQMLQKHVQQRYVSYHSGFGARLLNSEVTFEDCEEQFRKSGQHSESQSSRSEHWETVFQRYLDNSYHI